MQGEVREVGIGEVLQAPRISHGPDLENHGASGGWKHEVT